MFTQIFSLILGLVTVLLAAEAFTNGLEGIGKRFSFSQAVVGNLLAAVGTALPETILPLVAIFFSRGHASEDIGVGAILGAPFMLSTIAFFLVGITVMIRCLRHKKCFAISPDLTPLKRDLSFFIPMYSLAVFLPLIIGRSMDMIIALALLLGYVFYVKLTMTGESSEIGHFEGLHLFKAQKRLRLTKKDEPHTSMFFFQIIMALIVMVLGARIFVGGLEVVSLRLGMNPLLFALILAPLATELPEKFNSVTWILKGKDSLAMGNLTGAMMFQSTFPVAIGLLFTKWELTPMAIFSAVLALSSAGIALFSVKRSGRLSPYALLSGGFLYLVYIVTLVFNIKG